MIAVPNFPRCGLIFAGYMKTLSDWDLLPQIEPRGLPPQILEQELRSVLVRNQCPDEKLRALLRIFNQDRRLLLDCYPLRRIV